MKNFRKKLDSLQFGSLTHYWKRVITVVGAALVGLATVAIPVQADPPDDELISVPTYQAIKRPLLIVLLHDPDPDAPPFARSPAEYEQMITGRGGVSDYFSSVSYGNVSYDVVDVVSVVDRADDPSLGATGHGATIHLTRGIYLAAEIGVDFSVYDTDGDNIVRNNELTVLVIDNYSDFGAAKRGFCGDILLDFSANEGVGWNSVRYCDYGLVAGHAAPWFTYAHELMHTLGPNDIYGKAHYGPGLSLMAESLWEGYSWLDPWNRLQLGWTWEEFGGRKSDPIGRSIDWSVRLPCEGGNIPSLINPDTGERYLFEYRGGGCGVADSNLPGNKPTLVVWYVRDHADSSNRFEVDNSDTRGPANWAVKPDSCRFNPKNAYAHGDGSYRVMYGTYRLNWADGTDTGFALRWRGYNRGVSEQFLVRTANEGVVRTPIEGGCNL